MSAISSEELDGVAVGRGLTPVPSDMEGWRADSDAPVIVLVHGHAVTKKTWTAPYDETLGGALTFDLALADTQNDPATPYRPPGLDLPLLSFSSPWRTLGHRPEPMWPFLAESGFNLITWNQREIYGSYAHALEELEVVLEVTRTTFPGKSIVLLCHSRGGLVARKYVQEKRNAWPELRMVILLGCPNRGSKLATWVGILGKASWLPLAMARFAYGHVGPLIGLPRGELVRKLADCFRPLLKLVQGKAIDEMAPNSTLLRELKRHEEEERKSGIKYVNLMGNSNVFTKLFLVRDDGTRFEQVASFFDDLPDLWVPNELKDGRGDGLVAVERSQLEWAEVNRVLAVNHASQLIDDNVKGLVKSECDAL